MKLTSYRLLACLGAALALSACGSAKHAYDATADNNGYYVQAGGIFYQLQISRELNQYSVEDHQYLVGLPSGGTTVAASQLWYGVFLWAKNYGKHPATTASSFDIRDTQGNKYYPLALDPSINQFAWSPRMLDPLGTEPGPNTTASSGPTQGALLLFRLGSSAYDNRPLTLEIHPQGTAQTSTISLDL
ncbi:MAG TPA: hypothetical protein VIX82_12445 [Solirubrobacteraceae bacterium]